MPKLSKDVWEAIRTEYETNPTVSFGILAKKYGVHKSGVHQHAKREQWQKAGENNLINDAAYRRADEIDVGMSSQDIDVSIALKTRATRDKSEEIRAKIIVLHRQEWQELNAHRQVALSKMEEAVKAGDNKSSKQKWWNAKIASDTILHHMRALEIKQQGERRAWGLDQNQAQTQQPSSTPLLEIK